ncbi:hypothetical protein C266_16180 [Pandoraea sp. SD6-2]|nr:hypothetical protein C266_16180 [Pandoraea sp. SD6-2]
MVCGAGVKLEKMHLRGVKAGFDQVSGDAESRRRCAQELIRDQGDLNFLAAQQKKPADWRAFFVCRRRRTAD